MEFLLLLILKKIPCHLLTLLKAIGRQAQKRCLPAAQPEEPRGGSGSPAQKQRLLAVLPAGWPEEPQGSRPVWKRRSE
ncbi:hypothetical protein KIL84_016405, partial [Mauremys mutica]